MNSRETIAELVAGYRSTWRNEAACSGMDAALFFPGRGESTRVAKQVCSSCPVQEECAEFAITTGQKFGIWGGLSEDERKRIRRKRRLTVDDD